MQIQDALKEGCKLAGSSEMNLVCEILLTHVLKVNREYLFAHSEEKLDADMFLDFVNLLKRYLNGEPVAYIINKKEFYGFEFYIDNRALIPRPETEQLVEQAIHIIKDSNRHLNVLDIGTGSGNIAVSIAANVENCTIVAIDVSEDALEVAKINVEEFSLNDRIRLVKSDLLENVGDQKFDLVIANLPYIGTEANKFIAKNTYEYEPHVALFGGADGLQLYRRLFEQINQNNLPMVLIGEIGFMQSSALIDLLKKYFSGHTFEVHTDDARIDRMFIIDFSHD